METTGYDKQTIDSPTIQMLVGTWVFIETISNVHTTSPHSGYHQTMLFRKQPTILEMSPGLGSGLCWFRC